MKPVKFTAITLAQAKALSGYDYLCDSRFANSDGTAVRWHVNGKVKTWVRSPERVSIPVKRGLYTYDTVTEVQIARGFLYLCDYASNPILSPAQERARIRREGQQRGRFV